MNFDEFFKQAFNKRDDPEFGPFQYQRRLAEEPWPELLDIPTNLGKAQPLTVVELVGQKPVGASSHDSSVYDG